MELAINMPRKASNSGSSIAASELGGAAVLSE